MRSMLKPVTLSLVLLTGHAWAGDIDAGRKRSEECAACHGENGVSEIEGQPHLAGQRVAYLEIRLKYYRDNEDANEIMSLFAAELSDEDIADLAAYYASLERCN